MLGLLMYLTKCILWGLGATCQAARAPRIAIVADDLGETSLLPHLPQTIFTRSDLQPEHLFGRRNLLEDPALEVFKTEIIEELAAQRKKQEELEAHIGNVIARQETMEAKQDEISYDMKARVSLDFHSTTHFIHELKIL